MADRELWYAQNGPLLYDEAVPGWYDSYPTLPLRAALFSQAYATDAPVDDWELIRKVDLTTMTVEGDLMRIYMLMGA